MLGGVRADQMPMRTGQKGVQLLRRAGVLKLEKARHFLGKLALQTGEFQWEPSSSELTDCLLVAFFGGACETNQQLFLASGNIRS